MGLSSIIIITAMEQRCQRITKDGTKCGHKARVKAGAKYRPSRISQDVYYCMPCAIDMFKSSQVIFEGAHINVDHITYEIKIVCPEKMYDAKQLIL